MVFQPFLDQSRQRPGRGGSHVVSFALHGVVALLIWLAWGKVESGDPPVPAPVQVAVSLRQPSPDRGPGLAGPEAPVPAVERPKRSRWWRSASPRNREYPTPVMAIESSPEPPSIVQPIPEGEPDGEPGSLERGEDSGGTQAGGPGLTDGRSGESGDVGSPSVGRRPIELFGRVVGGSRREAMSAKGLPYAPLKESTALRTYDFFPRLPASQWSGDRAYMVVLDVCVSEEGQISDVALVRPASRIFDPVVLEAVRTWRYKPRLVDGHARPFCHVVAIKYEQL